jgi:predicted signal transduction protein with EAL and GGDEF domain
MWNPRYRNGEELVRDADAAMYRAKAQGKDRCAVFDEAMREEALRSLDLEADLRRAIINRDFLPYYQPIVRLSDGATRVLVRQQNKHNQVIGFSKGDAVGISIEADAAQVLRG